MKKAKAEAIVFAFCTFWAVAGLALCLTGLLTPNWYEREYHEGILHVRIHLGMWVDRKCIKGDCENFWLEEDGYTRPSKVKFPYHKSAQVLETVGVALGGLALISTLGLWLTRKLSVRSKGFAQALFFTSSLLSGFITVAGTLILTSKLENGSLEWSPIVSGVGGALFFIAGCLSCIICRFDDSYGTLENPVFPVFRNA